MEEETFCHPVVGRERERERERERGVWTVRCGLLLVLLFPLHGVLGKGGAASGGDVSVEQGKW
jgi:hypothetical protein